MTRLARRDAVTAAVESELVEREVGHAALEPVADQAGPHGQFLRAEIAARAQIPAAGSRCVARLHFPVRLTSVSLSLTKTLIRLQDAVGSQLLGGP